MKSFFKPTRPDRLILAASLLPLVFGCVTAGKYDKLESAHQKLEEDYQRAEQQLGLCAMTRSDLQKQLGISGAENSKLEGSVEDLKKTIQEAALRRKETEKRLAEFRDLTSQFKQLVNAGKLKIKVQNGRMTLVLSTDILFPSASAELSAVGKAAIVEVANILKHMNKRFQIEGHTDNLRIHTKQFPSNWELGSERAISVLNTMIAAGLSPGHISAASYANFEPVSDNDTGAGRAENRRIDIVIVPDLSGLPGYDELNQLSRTVPTP